MWTDGKQLVAYEAGTIKVNGLGDGSNDGYSLASSTGSDPSKKYLWITHRDHTVYSCEKPCGISGA